ncbi:hypothetical protein EVAR_76098_1 [Eumeta japonica]|uniref:Nucleic-acid-binding protein from transposon X-element n=1 Tax=Eumeta variegata TaxID=151549 RepID=A0A4C1W411_EUMVA|nr:hypothetical protein EVAR_76098_1 [Eumeta japonica]
MSASDRISEPRKQGFTPIGADAARHFAYSASANDERAVGRVGCGRRCVKYTEPHLTSECSLKLTDGSKPMCVNCGEGHTANHKGCPKEEILQTNLRRHNVKNVGERYGFRSVPLPPTTNVWTVNGSSGVDRSYREPNRFGTSKKIELGQDGKLSTSAFGEDIKTVMSIILLVKGTIGGAHVLERST